MLSWLQNKKEKRKRKMEKLESSMSNGCNRINLFEVIIIFIWIPKNETYDSRFSIFS